MSDLELIEKYLPKEKWNDAKKLLATGYSIQYIIGNVEFYDTLINVDERVLIPRFETEYLVEKTINYLKKLNIEKPNILEIGTGSGCISIALKKHLNSNILAIDISKDAIDLAKLNAIQNKVEINFKVLDINEFNSNETYDVIISNPPYVPYNSIVSSNIKFEPQSAIYAKNNGLYYYDVILNKIKNNLKKDYLIAFEIGDKEGEDIKKLSFKYLNNPYVIIEKDYNNYERYVFISNRKLD